MRRSFAAFILFHFLLGCVEAPAIEVRRAEPAEARLSDSPRHEDPTGINDAARFIAGLPVTGSGPLADWTKTPEWIAFSGTSSVFFHTLPSGSLVSAVMTPSA